MPTGPPPDAAGAAAPLRAALDAILGRAGFAWSSTVPRGDVFEVLYEALPADAVRLVPRVAPFLGDLDGPCLDLWVTYDPRRDVVTTAHVEGQALHDLANAVGHHAAAAVERRGGAGWSPAAIATLLDVIFGAGD